MTNTTTTSARARLAEKMAPAYKAFGLAVSTETGRLLFALAYDSDVSLGWERDRLRSFDGKRPSKASQEAKYYEGMDLGKRNAFVKALASMASEMSGNAVDLMSCQRVVNIEIDAMRNRTTAEREAASIVNICPKALDL